MTGGAVNAAGEMWIGNNGFGVFNLSGGTVTVNNWLALGRNANTGFGTLNLSGSGTLVHAGAGNVELVNNNGNAIINQSGKSTFTNSVGTVQIGASGWGLYTASGGTASFGSTSLGNGNANGLGILTVVDSAYVNAGGMTLGGASGGSGLVNLISGVLAATQITATGTGTTIFNVNGGTLTAAPGAQTTFVNGLANMTVGSSGAVINTNGQTIAISSNLTAPSGKGVQSITASGNGYDNAPAVKITGGGGSGATAEATIDANGNLTGFKITNPGSGYTSPPTVSVVGADGTLSASAAAVLNSGNTSAGLTVFGGGMLTLTGSCNYSGATTVSSGTLQLGPAGLAHRWSFDNSLADSVGGVAAILSGSNTALGANAVAVAGSGSSHVNYVSLGNGSSNLLPTGNAPFTVQVWATENGVQNWSRIFDFGSTAGGNSNLFWSWTQGTNPPGVVAANSVNYSNSVGFTVGKEYNVSLVVTPSGAGSTLHWYQYDTSGNLLGSGGTVTTWNISKLTQANMWLGRSEYSDNDANASYDEVRIYDAALAPSQLAASSLAGPDTQLAPVVSVLPSATPLTIAPGGTLDLDGGSQQVASLSGGGSVINSNTAFASVLTVSATGTSSIFGGSIRGGGSLGTVAFVLSGGTETFSGVNTYTGGTTVPAGTLIVTTPAALPDKGSLSIGAASALVFGASAIGSSAAASAVPEPSTLALLMAAGIAAAAFRRRKSFSRIES